MKTKSAGFTLVELAITCCLIAIIAVLGINSFSFMQALQVKAEVELLHATCMAQQQLAIATNTSITIVFDEHANTYSVNGYCIALPKNVCFGTKPGVYGPPGRPEAAATKAITFKEASITFTPQGIIQPGTVYITDRSKKIAYALSCGVAQVSYLRKYRYDGRWHLINT